MGIIEDDDWDEREIVLPRNSRLAISTDGITEACNADNQQFGRATLLCQLIDSLEVSVSETSEQVRQQVQQHCGEEQQRDDITLLLIDITNEIATGTGTRTFKTFAA